MSNRLFVRRNRSGIIPGILTLVVALSLLTIAGGAQAQPQKPDAPVVVTNDSANPIPVEGDLTISNLPAVQEVLVNNLPAVQDVFVINNPPPPERVQLFDVTLIPIGDNGFGIFGFGEPIYTVPTGKRLIVETVSFFVSDLEGVNYDASLRGSNGASLSFALQTKGIYEAGSIPEKGRDSVTASALLIVNEGDELSYQLIRDVSSSPEVAGTSVTVVGQLEDMP